MTAPPRTYPRNVLVSLTAAALTMAALAFAPSAAFAQEDEEEGRRSAPTISQRTGEKLNEAIEFLNNDDYASARAVLADINLERLSPYERSRVEQIWSGIEYSEGNYRAAREHLQQAIAAGGFNERETSQAKYQIAQIFMTEENWEQGAAALEEWFRTAPAPNSSAYYLLAAAYYQMEDLDAALEPAKKAVEMSERPQSSWIELLLALYLTRENYDAALPLLERLIAMEPQEKNHWLRLSSLYQQQEEYGQALAAMQIAYNAGFLQQGSEYERLSDMLRFNDIPYRAARVLKEAMDEGLVESDSETYEKLANAWIQARDFEEAIPPLTRAAEMSDSGDLFLRLGQVQIQREEWQEALSALQQAVEKGDLEDPGQANLFMGIALFNLDRLGDARQAFERAARSEEQREMARDYIALIDSKR
ncbi:MAG TPA: tetratricopeptide repeat protein [Woeseiaceae bacterium]|nr:tetratricopeptide repeat protein [Woeseiaceae bacterium]